MGERNGSARLHRHAATAGCHVDAEGRHQFLRVGPCRLGLDDRRGAIGRQAGKQDTALHLGARHGWRILNAVQPATLNRERRQRRTPDPADRCPHGPERVDHPVHGAPPDRLVTIEHRRERQTGQHPGKQANARARVAHVQRPLGGSQAATGDRHHPVDHLDTRTQGLHDGHRVGHIGTVAEARDLRRSVGQGRQHHHPVRNGLVAGHRQPAGQRPAGCDGKRGHVSGPDVGL